MKPCISQTTTMASPLLEDVDAWSEAGCTGMEVWLTKLEQHLEKHSLSDTKKYMEDKQVVPAGAAYQGGLLLSQGDARRTHYDAYKKRLELCQGLGISTLLLVADFVEAIDPTTLERALVSLKQAAQWAAGYDVKLALEFRGKSAFCSSLDTALSLVMQAGEPNLGVVLDFFHYYTGPSKFEDLAYLTPESLAWVQVCDVAGMPRELATDSDRVLPGDGDFQLDPLIAAIRGSGYAGWVSLELFNPTLWRTKASHVAEIGMLALKRLLGTTS